MKEGILLINKPHNHTSFYIIKILRRITGIRKIGHTGTLDPLATGVMVTLIGPTFTKKAHLFVKNDKDYIATFLLGTTSNTFDKQGNCQKVDGDVPNLCQVQKALALLQGNIQQVPPMFSAKKFHGKCLYTFARKNIDVPRQPVTVSLCIKLISYEYPYLNLSITCSSGTYVRSIAHELGKILHTGAIVEQLERTRVGSFHLKECFHLNEIHAKNWPSFLKSVE